MLGYVIISALAVMTVCFFVYKRVTADSGRYSVRGLIVLPVTGDLENLSRLVKSYYWEEVFETDGLAREIILVTTDSCDERAYSAAKDLEEKYPIVRVTEISQLENYIRSSVNGKT
jgi:hypothetical protein